jgi:hypothetical protein
MKIVATSFLLVGSLCATTLARADGLYVSFFNTDSVGMYDAQSGALINATFASVQDALGLAVGPDHNLYVGSDNLASGNGAGIMRFGLGGTTGTAPGTFVDHVSDNALNNPQGLAFQGGNLYAGDITAGNIFVYNTLGNHAGTLSSPSLGAPNGLAFGTSGTLYVADLNQGNVLSYSGGNFAQVNSQPGKFDAAHSVAVGGNGKLYVLNISGATGGIYQLNPGDGSALKIVDYSTSTFQPADMVVGPDGKLYVSGQDLNTGEGEILNYGLDGSGGTVFADTGSGTSPGYITFETVPEPSAWSIAGIGVVVLAMFRRRAVKREAKA